MPVPPRLVLRHTASAASSSIIDVIASFAFVLSNPPNPPSPSFVAVELFGRLRRRHQYLQPRGRRRWRGRRRGGRGGAGGRRSKEDE
jgi:hypothetical protein